MTVNDYFEIDMLLGGWTLSSTFIFLTICIISRIYSKVSEKADHFTGFCQVGTERRNFQNLSFKTGEALQWVLREK